MKITLTKIDGHDVLNYIYTIRGVGEMCFHLLCEVGQPWQIDAKRALMALCDKHRGNVVQVELDRAPWYVDALVKQK